MYFRSKHKNKNKNEMKKKRNFNKNLTEGWVDDGARTVTVCCRSGGNARVMACNFSGPTCALFFGIGASIHGQWLTPLGPGRQQHNKSTRPDLINLEIKYKLIKMKLYNFLNKRKSNNNL